MALRHQLSEAEKECASANSALASLEDEALQLRVSLSMAQKESERLRGRVAELETTTTKLREARNQQVIRVADDSSDLHNDLRSSRTELELLRTQLEEKGAVLAATQKQLQRLQQESTVTAPRPLTSGPVEALIEELMHNAEQERSQRLVLEAKLQHSEGMLATLTHMTQTLRDTLDDTQSQAARHLCDLADSFASQSSEFLAHFGSQLSQRSENQARVLAAWSSFASTSQKRLLESERRHLAITDAHNDNMQRLAVAWREDSGSRSADLDSVYSTVSHLQQQLITSQTTAAIEGSKAQLAITARASSESRSQEAVLRITEAATASTTTAITALEEANSRNSDMYQRLVNVQQEGSQMAILAHSNQALLTQEQYRIRQLEHRLEDREADCLTLAGRLTTSTGEASALAATLTHQLRLMPIESSRRDLISALNSLADAHRSNTHLTQHLAGGLLRLATTMQSIENPEERKAEFVNFLRFLRGFFTNESPAELMNYVGPVLAGLGLQQFQGCSLDASDASYLEYNQAIDTSVYQPRIAWH